ncbi:MAG TPA: AAA family ATPase [Ktedonobacteraceae bacterium]|nr:AAA family ATPase [Ktedonobacteraceae bacterium]
MLTQIEIDGFKTFKDFKVELAPFQVIVGPNGSGKSNLFDALELLSRFASKDLRSAFQDMRGDADDLFTLLPDGKHVDRIRIAVEMLVDKKVEDRWGREAELKYKRFRYEIEVVARPVGDTSSPDELLITHELLRAISPSKDTWGKKHNIPLRDDWKYFIQTYQPGTKSLSASRSKEQFDMNEETLIELAFDTDTPMKGIPQSFSAAKMQSSALSSVNDIHYPHAFAVREELCSLKFLHLNPEELRQPSSVKAPSFLSAEGSNLPTMLQRMQREDKFALNDVSRDLANLVPDVVGVILTKDDILNKYTVWVKYMDGRSFPSSVLSDGTLYLLALAALRNDPQFHGVLCFEEPENGINPSYLKDVAHLLRSLTTDFHDPEQIDEPLRQVLVTTHSTAFISQPDVSDSLLFAFTVTRIEPQKYTIQITEMVPVVTSNTQHMFSTDIDKAQEAYTIHQVEKYLDSESLDEARAKLGRK